MSDLENPDTHVSMDIGIAAQATVMAAREMGYGACMIRSFNPEKIARLIGEVPSLYPNLVIALGVDNEIAKVVDMENGDIRYYKDDSDVNVVPKRTVTELIVN
jgi:nitroreductase